MKNQGFVDMKRGISGEKAGGNAIVIVLIMIALLGALTLTLTRMGSNSNDISQEQAQVIASQVLRQAKTLESATSNLLAKGCSLTQLSFDNSLVSGYTNAQSPVDKSCWLFDLAGAGLNFPTPPANSNDGSNWFFGRNNTVFGVGQERETLVQPTNNSAEIIMILPFVNEKVCRAINTLSGVSPSFSTAVPVITKIDIWLKFTASVTTPTSTNFSAYMNGTGDWIGSATTPLSSQPLWDKKVGCVAPNNYADPFSGATVAITNKYFAYQVLVER